MILINYLFNLIILKKDNNLKIHFA